MTDDEKNRKKSPFIEDGGGIVGSSSTVTDAERKRADAFLKKIHKKLISKATKCQKP